MREYDRESSYKYFQKTPCIKDLSDARRFRTLTYVNVHGQKRDSANPPYGRKLVEMDNLKCLPIEELPLQISKNSSIILVECLGYIQPDIECSNIHSSV